MRTRADQMNQENLTFPFHFQVSATKKEIKITMYIEIDICTQHKINNITHKEIMYTTDERLKTLQLQLPGHVTHKIYLQKNIHKDDCIQMHNYLYSY